MASTTLSVGWCRARCIAGTPLTDIWIWFVLPVGAVRTARAIAKHYQTGFVLLDAEHELPEWYSNKLRFDFAQQRSQPETDLSRRDFASRSPGPYTGRQLIRLGGCADPTTRGCCGWVQAANLIRPLTAITSYGKPPSGFLLSTRYSLGHSRLAPQLGQMARQGGWRQAIFSSSSRNPMDTCCLGRVYPQPGFKSDARRRLVVAVDEAGVSLAQTAESAGRRSSGSSPSQNG